VNSIQLTQPIFARAFALLLEGSREDLVHHLTGFRRYVVLTVHPFDCCPDEPE